MWRLRPAKYLLGGCYLSAFCVLANSIANADAPQRIPDKTVVLTLDDAVKSHITVVAPLLKQCGFGATFFVSQAWMDDKAHFMTWEDIAELNRMGFEIGNHSWTHPNFGDPEVAGRMAGELALVENELHKVGVPKPISFAWTGNGFGPEALAILRGLGYQFARRGMQPEFKYGTIALGPLFEPGKYDPLLIPTSGDAYPVWTLEHFKTVVDRAKDGKIAILQFHGVPDEAHPWVHTPPERFREYMAYLHDNGFHVIAMRDLAKYIPFGPPTPDAMDNVRYPTIAPEKMRLPQEQAATRADLPFWLPNMLVDHHYNWVEAALVCGFSVAELQDQAAKLQMPTLPAPGGTKAPLRVLPYPGGRHPRIGFLDGAIDPMRGTKASIFTPWSAQDYVVVDLPEAIFSNLGLIYLAHTHVPTIWNAQNKIIENVDWTRDTDGSLHEEWTLPNGIKFGAAIHPKVGYADLDLWLENGTKERLTGLRTQICVMLKGAEGFNAQTQLRKRYEASVAAVKSESDDRWIYVAFERCGKTWGNPQCPCIHSDPVLPDAAPGQRVSVKGRINFYEGSAIKTRLESAQKTFPPLVKPKIANASK